MTTLPLAWSYLAVVSSGLATLLATPRVARLCVRHGLTGVDVHKMARPKCAEMGGAAVLLGFVTGLTSLLVVGMAPRPSLWAGFLTILLAGAIGIFDDVKGIRQRYKPVLVGLVALPLSLTYAGDGGLWLPILGRLHFGVLYPVLLIPLAVATSANLTNMLAGFNGLEAGLASIALGSLGVLSFLAGHPDVALLSWSLAASFAAFLRFNWFPARVFPGDSGTLTSGAAIAVIAILTDLEFAAIVMSLPAAFDFTWKMLSRKPFAQRSVYGDSRVTDDGVLIPPPYASLPHAFLRLARLNERTLVASLLGMELTYAAIAIALTTALR